MGVEISASRKTLGQQRAQKTEDAAISEESMSKGQALLDISAFSHSGIAEESQVAPKSQHDIVEMLARSGNQFARRLKLERRNANQLLVLMTEEGSAGDREEEEEKSGVQESQGRFTS